MPVLLVSKLGKCLGKRNEEVGEEEREGLALVQSTTLWNGERQRFCLQPTTSLWSSRKYTCADPEHGHREQSQFRGRIWWLKKLVSESYVPPGNLRFKKRCVSHIISKKNCRNFLFIVFFGSLFYSPFFVCLFVYLFVFKLFFI